MLLKMNDTAVCTLVPVSKRSIECYKVAKIALVLHGQGSYYIIVLWLLFELYGQGDIFFFL